MKSWLLVVIFVIFIYNSRSVAVYNLVLSVLYCCVRCCLFGGVWWYEWLCGGMHDCVWTCAVFIVWNLLEDTAQLQPWPRSLAYCQEVKGIRVGLNLCSKTVSWADVLFAYSCTATLTSPSFQSSLSQYLTKYFTKILILFMDLNNLKCYKTVIKFTPYYVNLSTLFT